MRNAQLLETLSNCLNIDTSTGGVQIFGDLQQGSVKSALLYADSNGKIIAAPDGAGGGGGLTAVGVNDLTAVGLRSNETFLRGDNTFSSLTDFNITDALGYTPYNGAANSLGFLTTTTGDVRYLKLTGGTLTGDLYAPAFFESSDKNLKTLLKSDYIPDGIERVESRLYIKNDKEELGYFAQDVESILPSAVSVNSDGFLSLSYREVHTAKIAYLEKEVKELKAQLARL